MISRARERFVAGTTAAEDAPRETTSSRVETGKVNVLDRRIVKVVVCLVVSLASVHARAQSEEVEAAPDAPPADDARASVELSVSVAPQLVLGRLLPASGLLGGLGSGAVGGLGNAGAEMFPLGLDAAFALAPTTFLAVGVAGMYGQSAGSTNWSLSVPLSLLFYLDTPRVGRVLPTLRVGVGVAYYAAIAGAERSDLVSGQLFVRGGVTWLAAQWLGLRAEVGLSGQAVSALGTEYVFASVGFDASIALVMRI